MLEKLLRKIPSVFTILSISLALPLNAQTKYKKNIEFEDVERRGFYDIMKLYSDAICIKEIPFLIALHRCFHQDKILPRGYMLILKKHTILSLKKKAMSLNGMEDLENSLIYNIKSLVIYKKKKNRYKKNLCNFIIYLEPGAYEIPKTGGAKLVVPKKIMGSIYYNKKHRNNKMTVYLHTGGIKLELPRYAKTISLGIIGDMDIGIAVLEFLKENWITRLLYVKSKDNPKRKGWSFNVTKCGKIRPYSK